VAAAVDYALLSWIHVEAPMKKEGQVKNTLNPVVVEEGQYNETWYATESMYSAAGRGAL